MFDERSVAGEGGMLNVAFGRREGPPLLFLHGLGRCGRDFAPLFAGLAPWGRPIAVDHRGHGRSGRTADYRVVDYVADAIAVLRTLEQPAVLIGHSLGALTALGVAAAEPERVRGAVLLDPPGPGFLANLDATPYAPMWRAMQRLAGSPLPTGTLALALADLDLPAPGGTVKLGAVRDMAALRFMASCLRDLDPAVLTRPLARRWLDDYDLFALARRVQCPTLLLAADTSVGGMLPDPEARLLTESLADGTRLDLHGIGHLLHWQDAPTTLRLLHRFLGSL